MDVKTLADMPPYDWPEGTDEVILGVLVDQRAEDSDRLIAAELAGDHTVVNERLADALLSILESGEESEELRAKAAIAFGPALEHSDTNGFDDPEDNLVSEEMFGRIQRSFQKLHMDADVPKYVRQKVLEAAIRAPQEWHEGAIRVAYNGDDEDWKLTAVFCMIFVPGFDDEIVEALDSEHHLTHIHAIQAAGTAAIDAAWPHLSGLVRSGGTKKDLLLATIEAVASIRPSEVPELLAGLTESADEDIQEAVFEALADADVDGLLDDEGDSFDEDHEEDGELTR